MPRCFRGHPCGVKISAFFFPAKFNVEFKSEIAVPLLLSIKGTISRFIDEETLVLCTVYRLELAN